MLSFRFKNLALNWANPINLFVDFYTCDRDVEAAGLRRYHLNQGSISHYANRALSCVFICFSDLPCHHCCHDLQILLNLDFAFRYRWQVPTIEAGLATSNGAESHR